MSMQLRGGNVATLGMIVLLSMSGAARAEIKSWKAATSGDWFTGSNGAEGPIPEAGDAFVISSSGSVISQTNATPERSSFRLSAGLSREVLSTVPVRK